MPELSIIAVILAAGKSRRFGSTKQLAEFEGETLVRRAVRLGEEVCGERSVLVVGSDWWNVLASCAPQRGFFVRNENHESGMASSIACGVGSVETVASAILLLLMDQPLVTADHLNALIDRWRGTPQDIVASEYDGILGPPVIFPQRCFASLTALTGDQGARTVVQDKQFSVCGIAFDAAGIDIDTPAEYRMLLDRS